MTNWEHYGDGQIGRDKYAKLGYLTWSEWGNAHCWVADGWITDRVPDNCREVMCRLADREAPGCWYQHITDWSIGGRRTHKVYGWKEIPPIPPEPDTPAWNRLPTLPEQQNETK
jgi:hypothetical protein